MTKKISKILLTILLIVAILISMVKCFAEEETITEENVTATADTSSEETTTSEEDTATDDDIYSGDLYLCDSEITMDKLVDGNVFLIGNKVHVTGQVNGNLFVLANELIIGDVESESDENTEETTETSQTQCYIRNTIFACASSVYYNGACNDLYVATQKLEMTYDSYIVRDVKAVSASTILKSAVGRDVDLISSVVDMGTEEDAPIIYGNLRYSSSSEANIPNGAITDTNNVTYTPLSSSTKTTSSVYSILINFLTSIVTVLAVYFAIKFLTPEFNNKISNVEVTKPLKWLKSFGIGLLAMILPIFVIILLMILPSTIKLSLILSAIYALLILISVPVLSIIITNGLKSVLKLDKLYLYCIVLALVKVILYGLTLLPFVGGILTIIIVPTAIGSVVCIFLPCNKSKEVKIDE